MRDFVDLEDHDDTTIERLLARARALERAPRGTQLAGRVMGLLFFNPSLRTLASFQAGMAQLGGGSFVISPGQASWQLETRRGVRMDGAAAEHIREAVPVLEQYCDVLGVRAFAERKNLTTDLGEPILSAVREVARGPIVSLESAVNHPCQALADWKTLDDLDVPRRGGRFVLSWAWHPKALPLAVPAAVVSMAARRGMDVTVLRPDAFALPPGVLERARTAAQKSGGRVRETADRIAALDGAQVLYAKSWGAPTAYGDDAHDAAARAPHQDWCVAEDWFRGSAPGSIFLHCLPVRRNVVVSDEVIDGPRSRVIQQAGNRLHVQKAVLLEMLATEGDGATPPIRRAREGSQT
ncbi:MAG: N-acetylornithine carbamoyltransferase [Planctomycetota bacterium]